MRMKRFSLAVTGYRIIRRRGGQDAGAVDAARLGGSPPGPAPRPPPDGGPAGQDSSGGCRRRATRVGFVFTLMAGAGAALPGRRVAKGRGVMASADSVLRRARNGPSRREHA